jgi:hypothetical protein
VQEDVGGSGLGRLDRGHHLRGAVAGRRGDCGLHLDPQHGVVMIDKYGSDELRTATCRA